MAAHARRGEGRLTADELCDLWRAENARLYGDAVEMPTPYRWGWSYIPHFIHSRFYCYSYVFGELLVLALYQRWLDEGAAFVPRYLELLAAGGSEAPDRLARAARLRRRRPDLLGARLRGAARPRGGIARDARLTPVVTARTSP